MDALHLENKTMYYYKVINLKCSEKQNEKNFSTKMIMLANRLPIKIKNFLIIYES